MPTVASSTLFVFHLDWLWLLAGAGTLAALYVVARVRRHRAAGGPKGCPGCGTANPPHASFCRECGRELR